MTEFVQSLKADLLDRRLMPLVALVAVALAGAIAYAALSGGASTTTPTPANPAASASPGLAVSQSTPEKAVSEITAGSVAQHRGTAHNPFTPLPEPKAKAAATTSTKSSSSASSSSSTGSGSSGSAGTGSSGGASEPSPVQPSKPAKPKTVYHVAVLFGAVSAPTTVLPTQLTPYENLKLLTPLPSASEPLLVFRGVTAGGKSATFTLVGEAILHGPGQCLPSAAQCEALDMSIGQSEKLEYLTPAGLTVIYELNIVSITSSKVTTAGVKTALHQESKAGRELLKRAGLQAIPDLRSSSQAGVLVFRRHP
jgi:hypothetical protein